MRRSLLGIVGIALIWTIPALAVSFVALEMDTALSERGQVFLPKYLLTISENMIVFLGVVTAVMMAVITTMYGLISQKQESGFSVFLASLNQFRNMSLVARNNREQISAQNRISLDSFVDQTDKLIESMNEITPSWRGYDSAPEIEAKMLEYVEDSGELLMTMGASATDNSEMSALSEIFNYRDESVRGMLIGLLDMDRGVIGGRLMTTLLILSLSLTILLILSLVVLTITAPKDISLVASSSPFNLFIYGLLPATAIFHIVGFICAMSAWWRQVQKRDKEWQSPDNRKGQISTDTVRRQALRNPILVFALLGVLVCTAMNLWRLLRSRLASPSYKSDSDRNDHKQ